MTTGVLCSGRKRVYRSAAIHLWRFSLAHAENGISWARPLLSPEELERGARSAGPATQPLPSLPGLRKDHPCRPQAGCPGLRHRFLLRSVGKTLLARPSLQHLPQRYGGPAGRL